MKKMLTIASVGLVLGLMTVGNLAAQDLVITNARILVGDGEEIGSGTIVVRGGQIVSVGVLGASGPQGATQIDAQGMTVMPGYIDAHRHVMGGGRGGGAFEWLDQQGPQAMQSYLDGGFTTILSAGDGTEGILELRRRLAEGEITGPRLITSGRANTNGTPEEAREEVRRMAQAGVDAIKSMLTTTPGGNQAETMAAIADEARRQGIPSIVHVTEVNDMMRAVEAGITRLVHTPHTGSLEGTEGARMVADAGIPVTSTLGVYIPRFGEENVGRITPGGRGAVMTPPNLSRGGQGAINARHLWDAGATYGYGTDTGYVPIEALEHELRPLSLFFSGKDIVTILTKNAAVAVGLSNEIGTLEAGKLADIVIVDGDPIADHRALLNIEVVIKSGNVVVDNR